MTATKNGIKIDVEWIVEGKWSPKCKDCRFFNYKSPADAFCDNDKSDHYYHMLYLEHPACSEFLDDSTFSFSKWMGWEIGEGEKS